VRRLAVLAAAAGLALGQAGCRSDGDRACDSTLTGTGAVVVRWRPVDSFGGRQLGCTSDRLVIDQVRLDAVRLDVDGGRVVCPSCTFQCGLFEGTTAFELPAGRYQLGIEALSCGVRVGGAPPQVVRCVRGGEVTNLNAVEILVSPCEYTRCGMPPDAGVEVCDAGG
jgi:hypothetical protein